MLLESQANSTTGIRQPRLAAAFLLNSHLESSMICPVIWASHIRELPVEKTNEALLAYGPKKVSARNGGLEWFVVKPLN